MTSANQRELPENRLDLTNDYSTISKYSAAKLGYYHDPLLLEFVEDSLKISKGWRRAPIVNLGYTNRVMAVNHSFSNLINEQNVDTIIVLGSGFDMRPAYWATRRMLNWIEIDLAGVIEKKVQFYKEKCRLKTNIGLLQEDVYASPDGDLHLIGCDMRDTKDLALKLTAALARPRTRRFDKVAILNEVCLCYLEPIEVKRVLLTITDCIRDRGANADGQKASSVSYLGFEQVRPSEEETPFTKIMLEHFKSMAFPLKHFPSVCELRHMFLSDLKFDSIQVEPLHSYYHALSRLPPSERTIDDPMQLECAHREPFDEFEEMDLYSSHYGVVRANLELKPKPRHGDKTGGSKNLTQDNNLLNAHSGKSDQSSQSLDSRSCQEEFDDIISRFGHSACVLQDTSTLQSALISGGFGLATPHSNSANTQHRRLNDCLIIRRDDVGRTSGQTLSLAHFPADRIRLDRMHGQVCCVNQLNGLVMFSGGRQSPSASAATSNASGNATFLARITDDDDLRLELLHELDNPDLNGRWRHRLIKSDCESVIQMGGLIGFRGETAQKAFTYLTWNLSRLDYSQSQLDSLEPRHSFGLDVRDSQTMLIFGGLKAGQATHRPRPSNPMQAHDAHKNMCSFNDNDHRPTRQAFLHDRRINGSVVNELKDLTASYYGMQVHFTNSEQFVRVGGISAETGLSEQSIGLYDLRRFDSCLSTVQVESERNDLILCNTQSLNFKTSGNIITLGGGGNFFTFGTHFNRSRAVYKYK